MASIICVSNFPGAADERESLHVFIVSRPFPDEDQLGVRIARAKDDLVAWLVQLASRAVAQVSGDALERVASMRSAASKSEGPRTVACSWAGSRVSRRTGAAPAQPATGSALLRRCWFRCDVLPWPDFPIGHRR